MQADLLLLECVAPAKCKCRKITLKVGGISTCGKVNTMEGKLAVRVTGTMKHHPFVAGGIKGNVHLICICTVLKTNFEVLQLYLSVSILW